MIELTVNPTKISLNHVDVLQQSISYFNTASLVVLFVDYLQVPIHTDDKKDNILSLWKS